MAYENTIALISEAAGKAYGKRAFLTEPLAAHGPSVRAHCEALARECGANNSEALALSDAQLIALYMVACGRRPAFAPKKLEMLLAELPADALPDAMPSEPETGPQAMPEPVEPEQAKPEPFPPVAERHAMFPRVKAMLEAGIWPYLVGHAGTGKTTLAQQVAEALNVPFYCQSSVENASDLLGFLDMRGNATNTPFKEAFIHGGLFLLDEMDNSDSSALTAFNAAIANLMAMFPDGMQAANEKLYFIGAGNTNGDGSCMIYNRAKLDFATRDRFEFLTVDYDPAIEAAMSNGNTGWLQYCRAIREAAFALPVRGMIAGGPRAIKAGAKMIEIGFTPMEAAEACFFNKMTKTDAERLQDQVRINSYIR